MVRTSTQTTYADGSASSKWTQPPHGGQRVRRAHRLRVLTGLRRGTGHQQRRRSHHPASRQLHRSDPLKLRLGRVAGWVRARRRSARA